MKGIFNIIRFFRNGLFLAILVPLFLQAQQHKIDSLKGIIKTQEEDSSKVINLNALSSYLLRIGKSDTSIICANTALALAEKRGYKKGIAEAYRNTGVYYLNQGNYAEALAYDNKSLEVNKEIGNKIGIATNYGNIGVIYDNEGNYSEALDYYLKSLAINKELGNKKGVANNLSNIGLNYSEQGNYSKALEQDGEALEIYEAIGDKIDAASDLGNIGNIYDIQRNFPEALEYDFKVLIIDKELNDKADEAIVLSNIGLVYGEQENYPQALEYENKALTLSREMGDKDGVAYEQQSMGSIFTDQKAFDKAKIYLDSALNISKSIGDKTMIKSSYGGLSDLESARGNFQAALQDYKNYVTYRDSIINEANTKKTVRAEMNFEFEQKQATAKAEQDKKDALAAQERKKQLIIRDAFMAGFALVLSLAFLIFRGYRNKQKANEIITKQKEEVEEQKALVEHQKELVEEKQKEIVDSITYAKRLQEAILPPLNVIEKCLPESFILYKPKDIVAGDFYWMETASFNPPDRRKGGGAAHDASKNEEIILIAAADCTGHGVPGAMVSVVCSNALNRAVKEFRITEPGKVLDKVRELVLETFEKSGGEIKDGMDISLVSLAPFQGGIVVSWAGAYNPLWYIENGKLKELAPDKQPIGKTDNPRPFTTHTITLNPPKADRVAGTLYLFTDGYADQFGGPKGKKYKYKKLSEKIKEICNKPMAEQMKILEEEFIAWKGELEQTDDVCIIGIRV